jgi:hypothetical protein
MLSFCEYDDAGVAVKLFSVSIEDDIGPERGQTGCILQQGSSPSVRS